MLLRDVFSPEGGLFVVDLEDESLKMLTPSHLKPKKKKKKSKKKAKKTGNEDSDVDDEFETTNPGLMYGSATSALEDDVSTSDFGVDEMTTLPNVHSTSLLDNIKLTLCEMQKTMEEERQKTIWLEKEMTSRLEKEAEKSNRLEKEMIEKTSRLEHVEREVEVERKKTSKLEREMEAEQKKTSQLEKDIIVERKKRGVLEVDVDDLKQSTSDIADWIVAGCIPKNGGEPLRRIQIRNLLDRVQAKLAWLIGATGDRYSRIGSALWRESLEGATLSERVSSARTLLRAALQDIGDVTAKVALAAFMSCDEAMQLAVEAKSQFRIRGDQIAHHDLTKHQFISIGASQNGWKTRRWP
jgi:hypothetical protein